MRAMTKVDYGMKTKQERMAYQNRPRYEMFRKVNLLESLKSRDFWLAMYLFVGFQGSILFLTLSSSKDDNKLYLAISMILALVVTIHGLYMARQRQRVKFRYEPIVWWKLFLSVIFIYLGVFSISVMFVHFDWNIIPQPNQDSLNKLMQTYFLPMTFITTVVAPIAEELTFREFLPHAFGPSYASFIISSIIFAILHSPTGLIGIVMYGFLSIAFLYLRMTTNNISTVIYAHMGYNLLTVLLALI